MKRIIFILALLAVISVFIVSCNEPAITPSDSNYSEYEGVYLTIDSISYYDDYEIINVTWHNETNYEVTYGSTYDIKRYDKENWETVSIADVAYKDIAHIVAPNSTSTHSYQTSFFDTSKNGTYRLCTSFYLNISDRGPYSIWVEFDVSPAISHKVTMKNEDWLFEKLKDSYNVNEKVTVKIRTVTDTGYLLLANGKRVKQVLNTDGSYECWEFAFTMPDEDVVLEFKTYDGFLKYPNEGKLIENYILANPDIDTAWIDCYYGEYESGAIVAIIKTQSDETEKLKTEKIFGFNFTYPNDNTVISVLYNSSFYSLKEAYQNGYLSNADLEDIYMQHTAFFDELYFHITQFPEFSDLDTDADKIVVNFDNYTASGFEFEITNKNEIKGILENVLSTRIEYEFEDVPPGNSSCQTLTVYKGNKTYKIKDYFILPNGFYRFNNHKLCDRICELATNLGAWDEIKTLNDVAMYGGDYQPFYVPDTADLISMDITDCGGEKHSLTVTDEESIVQILSILKSAKISNHDSPTNGNGYFDITINYSGDSYNAISNIKTSFELQNRYFNVNTNELYNYIITIE